MIILTSDARIAHWSPSAARLFGWSAQEVAGRHVAKVLGLASSKSFSALQASLLVSEAWAGGICVRRRDGLQFMAQLSSSPVVDAEGSQVSVIRVAGDPPEALRETRPAVESRQTDGVLRRLSAIIESSIDGIISTTAEGTITTWNGAAERIYGYSPLEAIGRSVSIIVPPGKESEVTAILARVAAGEPVEQLQTTRQRKDGTQLQVLLSVWAVVDDDGDVIGTCGLTHDISDRITTSLALAAADIRFDAAFEQSAVGMIIANLDGWPTAVNSATCRILGRRPDELVGHPWMEYAPPNKVPISPAGLARLREGNFSYDAERQYIRPDGSAVWLHVIVHAVKGTGHEVTYFMAHLHDITERKLMEQELHFQTLHDSLTGLPNRTLLDSRVDDELNNLTPTGGSIGLAFLDVDGFKHVNDALGHGIGDELLIELSKRLCAVVSDGDMVARFGGDEFVLVCHDVTLDMMTRLATEAGRALARPFFVGGRQVALRASFGITLSRLGSTSQSLLSEADAAMYRAKELGRGLTVVFDDSLRARAEVLVEGERALAAAIEAGDVVAFYQPIVELSTGKAVGVEALARWKTVDGRIAGPSEFIPLAESTGLIISLGELILHQAASDVVAWNARRPAGTPIWVSVNLSVGQLVGCDVVQLVKDVLRSSGLPAALLHLEITETVAMEHLEHSIVTLTELKQLGVHLSIDDFGTGYSSLAYLQRLPFDVLKVDGSFLRHLGPAPADGLIVKAILGMAEALGMTCIAEGVETVAQRDALLKLGCQLGQGYLWSEAMAGPEVARWATEGRSQRGCPSSPTTTCRTDGTNPTSRNDPDGRGRIASPLPVSSSASFVG